MSLIARMLLIALVLLSAAPAWAAQYMVTSYVEVTFNHCGPTTAFFYDANFNQFPTASWNGATSSYVFPPAGPDGALSLVAADFELVTRDMNGTVTNVSNIPTFSEMNHHFVMQAVHTNPDLVEFPVGVGSELTDWDLPPGYGYQISGAEFGGATWHWDNAAGVNLNGLRVFIQLNFTYDDDPTLIPVRHAWFGSANVITPPTPAGTTSPPVSTGKQPFTGNIVHTMPHVHDHCDWFELRLWDPAANGGAGGDAGLITNVTPANSLNYPVEHDDPSGVPCHQQQPITWHAHGSGNGHLPVGGLSEWEPTSPFNVPTSLQVYVKAQFDNPHAQSIDNMLLFLTFYTP